MRSLLTISIRDGKADLVLVRLGNNAVDVLLCSARVRLKCVFSLGLLGCSAS